MDSINSVDKLDKVICESGGGVRTYYNSVKGEFSYKMDNQTIPLKLIGQNCGTAIKNIYGVKITQTDHGFIIDSQESNRDNLSNLIRDNQLNHGKDPSLSERPEDFLITVKTIDGNILGTGKIIKIVIEAYLDALKQQRLLDLNSSDTNGLIKLGQEYPLNLSFE